jgi:hypothetical protein
MSFFVATKYWYVFPDFALFLRGLVRVLKLFILFSKPEIQWKYACQIFSRTVFQFKTGMIQRVSIQSAQRSSQL